MIFLAPPFIISYFATINTFLRDILSWNGLKTFIYMRWGAKGDFLTFLFALKTWKFVSEITFQLKTNARTYCSFGFLCLDINNPDIGTGGGNKPSISLFIPKILQRRRNLLRVWMQFDIKMENGKKAKVWIGALSLQNKGDLYTQGFGRKCNGRPIITLPPRLDWRQSSFFASLNARNHKILLAL